MPLQFKFASRPLSSQVALCARCGFACEVGYIDTVDIIEADGEEEVEILEAVASDKDLKKPKQRKFKRELAKLRGKGENCS